MKLQLYPWQKECLQIWTKHHCRGILHVVTGAGKTVLALSAIEKLEYTLSTPLRVKIVVPQTFLTAQWSNAMQKLSEIPREKIGCYSGSRKDSTDRPYMIYVINSARYTLSRHILNDINKGYAVLLIADECHHYASRENRKIFEFLPCLGDRKEHYYSLGLSATPRTPGYEQYLVPALGSEIYRYTFLSAAENNNICSFSCFNISLRFTPEENAAYQDLSERLTSMTKRLTSRCPSLKNLKDQQYFHALKHLTHSAQAAGISDTSRMAQIVLSLLYQRTSLLYNAQARVHCALRLTDQLDNTARILIFGERIQQADHLYQKMTLKYPGQVGRYHSKMTPKARKSALDRYKSGETRILITCRALDEGFDIPSANVGIVLSSSSLERQRIQRLGRILRNSGENTMAGLYYLYIQNTSERPHYMEETASGSVPAFALSYDDKSGNFQNPAYEALALTALEKLKNQGKTQRILDECRRCLSLGLLRPDWLMEIEVITEKINRSDTAKERNYWICMKMVALLNKEIKSEDNQPVH